MKKAVFVLLILVLALLTSLSLAQTDFDADLAELLADYVAADELGVVVYLNYAGESAIAAAGLADLEAETPVQTDDLFRLASITKSFVATLILQLVAEGKMDLERPIADYIPAELSQNIANANTATLRQVLQMTSGIPDYLETDAFYDTVYANPSRAWTAAETLEFIFGEDAYFEAGADYYYSNSNYMLAQIALEGVTGNSLAEELENRIFTPLGMNNCYLETPDVFAQNIVRGYELNDDDEFEDVTEINDAVGLGDGGIVCPAADLGLFLPALMNGEVLDDERLEQMLDTVDDGEDGQYGLGIVYDEWDFGMEVWHDGAASGFQSLMLYIPEEDLSLVILTNNFDSEIIWDLAYDALSLAVDN